MNSVALGFRDDITDDELEVLETNGFVFECSEHGVLEIGTGIREDELDLAIEEIRHPREEKVQA